jgi:hypothetical protein
MSEFSVNLPPRLPTAGAAASVLTAVVPDPPRHLTQLDNGTILRGTVQGRDPDGLLVVATDKGVIKLATPANLAPGSQVTLEVRATGDRLQVLILATDTSGVPSSGQAPPRGTGGSTAPPPTTTGGTTAPPPQRPTPPPVPVAIVGSLLQGTVVQAAPDTLTQLFRSLLPTPQTQVPLAPNVSAPLPGQIPTPAPGQPQAPTITQALPAPPLPAPSGGAQSPAQPTPQPLPAGQPAAQAPVPAQAQSLPGALASSLQSDVRAKIESLFFASTQVPASGGTLPGGGAPVAQAQNLAASLKLLAALPTGSEVKLRLIAISPGQGQVVGQPVMLPGAAAASPSIISGRIAGYTPTGHAVLHSPLGAIVLQGNLSLPVGTELSVAIEPALPAPGAATVPSMPQSLLALSRGWPTLADVIAMLRLGPAAGNPAANPAAADLASALARLPQSDNRLAAGIVAAIQALRAGDVEALLGGLAALRQGPAGREEGTRKLRQEFAQISAQAQDKPGVDWRCFFIPVMDDGTIRQINLFYRRDRGKKDKGDDADKSGTRFIVEVDMSKMGPFQFDGLVREKRFDLMVRSHVALTPRMRHDIGSLFSEALELGSYKGNLVFQKVKEFPVSPLDEIEKSATRVSA